MGSSYSSQIQAIIDRAVRAARRHGKRMVGTEDLLLALLTDPAGVTALLESVGEKPEELRKALQPPIGRSFRLTAPSEQVVLTTNAVSCLQSVETPRQLLVAIIRKRESTGRRKWDRISDRGPERVLAQLDRRHAGSDVYRIRDGTDEGYSDIVQFNAMCTEERKVESEEELLSLIVDRESAVLCDLSETRVLGPAWATWLFRMQLRASTVRGRFEIRAPDGIPAVGITNALRQQLLVAVVPGSLQ